MKASSPMRIDAVLVSNFRGIEYVEIDGLSSSSVIIVSGRNGVGKSLLLEAITIVWSRNVSEPAKVVGPWGTNAKVDIRLQLTQQEMNLLHEFGRLQGLEPGHMESGQITLSANFNKTGQVSCNGYNTLAQVMANANFHLQHPFANIDLLPADRNMPRGEEAYVNTKLLGEEEARTFRQNVINSIATANRQQVHLSGVKPFLASLDYHELVAGREGKQPPDDFEIIVNNFEMATGKRIHRPRTDSISGTEIHVSTSAGVEHSVNDLSSGEQEVLGLMYFIRRLSARGGILLIDEPELHLHPALQRSLFSVIESVAERAQIWVSTHSPKLVTAAPLNAILHVVSPTGKSDNQIRRASDEVAKEVLLSDLGMHPIDLLQNDIGVVVEGPTDVERLQLLFPVELGRALMYQAGSADAVERVCNTLSNTGWILPWVCIRDRDLKTEDEVQILQSRYPELFVWQRRSLENHFLDPELISLTLRRVGMAISPTDLWTRLVEISESEREQVVSIMTLDELNRNHSTQKATKTGDIETDLRSQLEASKSGLEQKLLDLPGVYRRVQTQLDNRWEEDWPILVQGKHILGVFAKETPFKDRDSLVRALAATCGEHPTAMPSAFKDLHQRLQGLLSNDGATL